MLPAIQGNLLTGVVTGLSHSLLFARVSIVPADNYMLRLGQLNFTVNLMELRIS